MCRVLKPMVALCLASIAGATAFAQPMQPPRPGPSSQPQDQQSATNHFPTPLFRVEGVAPHLNLTPEQFDRLTTLNSQLQNRFLPDFNRLEQMPEKDRQARVQELLNGFRGDLMKSTTDILSQQQMNRFRQLDLQSQGFTAFANPEVQRQLNLTQDQLARLQKADDQSRQLLQKLRGQEQTDARSARQLQRTLQQTRGELLGQILSPQQQGAWNNMTGQPFNFPATYSGAYPSMSPMAGAYPGMGQGLYGDSGQSSNSGGSGQSSNSGGSGQSSNYSNSGQSSSGGKGGNAAHGSGQSGGGKEQTSGAASGQTPQFVPVPVPVAPEPGPFPEPLFRLDHVVRKLNLSREQFDKLNTMTAQLQHRYQPEFERIKRLDEKERSRKTDELLSSYDAEWLKGAETILDARQMSGYREFGPQTATLKTMRK